jgi:TonB-dependent SusC/RagA subfamily outer membrane receptor
MIAAWALFSVALTLLVALGAKAAEQLLAIWRLPRRSVWALALTLALVLPPALAVQRSERVAPASPVDATTARFIPAIQMTGARLTKPIPSRGVRQRALPVSPVVALDLERTFITIWLLSSMALFAFLFLSARSLRRERRRWREATVDGTRVLVAPNRGPAVIGVLRARIVLPEWALSLDEAARRLVIRHEREHLQSRDPQLLLFARLAPFLVPWNLPLWFIARRLELAVELDCDDRVLRSVDDARAYGLLLIEVGARQSTRLNFGAALAAPRSFLARRIAAMIADRPHRTIRGTALPVLALACVTVAAARLPKPKPIPMRRSVERAVNRGSRQSSVLTRIDSSAIIARRPRTELRRAGDLATNTGITPRAATASPTPRINADWENAPIEDVAAAFAGFSGRKITVAEGVTAWVTAHIVNQPWDEALEHIAVAHGLHLVTNADSSIVIMAASSSRSSPSSRSSTLYYRVIPLTVQQNRRVIGRVLDDSTGTPIAGAEIQVIGLQAVGEPNRACTIRDGTFALNVPDDSVHLEASAPGYQFAHATVGPRDTAVVFRGRGTGEHVQIESLEVVKGAAAASLYGPAAANGAVVVTTGRVNTPRQWGAGFFFVRGQPVAGRPLLVIDGVPITADILALTGVCQ